MCRVPGREEDIMLFWSSAIEVSSVFLLSDVNYVVSTCDSIL